MSLPLDVELVPGYRTSRIIKGGWQLAGGHGAVDDESAIADMRRYVDAGVTTFDCADIYSGVEALIGRFLRRFRQDAGASAAATIRVHTKFVPDLATLSSLDARDVERSVDRSLGRLGVDVLDLVQFSWWDYDVPRYVEVGQMLVDLQRKGKIRHIGATNFDTPHLRELLDAGVPVIAHQVQYSLVDRRVEADMIRLCEERGVPLLCYGSLLGGLLSDRYLDAPAPAEPFETRSLRKYSLIVDEFGGWPLLQELLTTLRGVAARLDASISAIALRWVLARRCVAGAIVGARDARHLADCLGAVGLQLSSQDTSALDAVLAQARGPEGEVFGLEREKGGRHAAIMRYDLNEGG